jgi:very-short-patch-repair endonuclease
MTLTDGNRLEARRPFTRSDALAAGISPKQLRGSRFRRVFTGVYVDARVPDHPLIRAEAALLIHPAGSFGSHATAAAVHQAPVPVDPLTHVTVPEVGDRRRRIGIRCHVGHGQDVVEVGRVRVSGPHQMFLELGSVLSLVDLVVVGDALVRMGRATPESLVEASEASSLRHAAATLRAARKVRRGVDSPMESRLRMLLVLAGLPEPAVDHRIRDDYGNVRRRFDLSYPSVRLIVEYDGRQHVEIQKNWESDLERREEFDDHGWRILVVTSKGIYREPARTVARVHQALRDRGWRGLPRQTADTWRPYFPGR